MKEVCSEIDIRGSAKRVWRTLTNFSNYPVWNPFIRVAGELKVGARPQMTILQPNNKNITYKPRISRIDAEHELRWIERGRIPWLLDSERVITIEPIGGRGVRVKQCQRYRGLFSLFVGKLVQSMEKLLEAFNIALKAQVERG